MRKLFSIPLFLISAFILITSFLLKEDYPMLEAIKPENTLTPLQALGKELFFDSNLSNPSGTSCASCHHPNAAFSDARHTSFSLGSSNKSGKRNTPSLMYASYSPTLYFDNQEDTYVGGYFWDGRAKSIGEQVPGPLLNPIEMNVGSKNELVSKVANAKYRELYLQIFGETSFLDTISAFNNIVSAIAHYEESITFNPFSSKYDLYLQHKVELSKIEKYGLDLFNDSKKGNCAACHPSTPDEKSGKVLFTDFTYDNIGVPSHAFLSTAKDEGLGKTLNSSFQNGKFKVPTLRNVALTAPYFHNGVFNTLKEVVEFYNSRDSGKFGSPEISENLNNEELGKLNLSEYEVLAIVAFLNTLTDNFTPQPQQSQNQLQHTTLIKQ
jgi:cytochrome c peroxidase